MSFLSRLSLANRSIVALLTIAILLFGGFVIPSLKQELLPSISFPAISVIAVYPGASPESIEQDVTNPLEKNIQGVQGLQSLTSYSNEGVSLIIVQYDYSIDLDKAREALTQQINKTQSSLPSGVTPQVQAFNIADQPIIRLAVTSSANQQDLATRLNQDVVPALQGVNGVGNVTVTGVRKPIVLISLDLQKLQENGLSVSQVQGALQANNLTIPAGEVTNNGQTVAIRAGSTFKSIDELKDLIVGVHSSTPSAQSLPTGSTTGGQGGFTGGQGGFTGGQGGQGNPATQAAPPQGVPTPVKLSDVATVQQTVAPSTTLTRTNGKESLGISITKTTDGNTVSVSQGIKDLLPDLEKKVGSNTHITVLSDQAPTIQTSVNDLIREGLIGAAFAILVILLFLLSLRSTLVTAVSIPLSIVIALIGLWVGKYSLNVLTLGGLTIAVGRVVDDSIVVLENIYRHLSNGEDKKTAVLGGVREVAGAITASTITTVAVFLPIAFTSGIVGQFFQPFSIAVTVALLASLFVALTIIPVLAYWFLKAPKPNAKGKQKQHDKPGILERAYVPMISWVTRHTAITLVIAVLLLIGSFSLLPRLGANLIGGSSSDSFSISMQMPVASSLETTNAATLKVEEVLQKYKENGEIKTYQSNVGSSGSSFSLSGSGSNQAAFTVVINPGVDITTLQQNVKDDLKKLSGIGTTTIAASSQAGSNSTINVNVEAGDDQTLQKANDMVLNAVKKAKNVSNVSSSLTAAAPLIDVHVNPQKALAHGQTAAQIGQTLRTIYSGTTVMQVSLNGSKEDVNITLGKPVTTVEEMRDLIIPTTTGPVKLSDMADVELINGPTQITHLATNRTATISATAVGQDVNAVSNDIKSHVDALKLPSGATVSYGGVTTQLADSFRSLGLALLAAIILVYVVMVATFRSLLEPLILLISVPFAGVGAILLLFVTHTVIGLPSLIGMLMLIGIVVTNAIVLLDLVEQFRKQGYDARSAVIEGGRRRVRPILMTAIATILALIPMALSGSGSSGFLSGPLAIVVIGGLTSSTFLTLLIVPTLYLLVEKLRGRSGSLKPEGHEPEPVKEDEDKREPVTVTAGQNHQNPPQAQPQIV